MERAADGDASLGRSLALVRFLREHCPWDARQTPESLVPYLLEEAHETADAVRRAEDSELPGELGDLLLNVAFQIVLAEERGAFDAETVVAGLERKMVARHPHVYGEADEPPDWEAMKAAERADPEDSDRGGDPLAEVPRGLEPLSRALRVQERAAGVGFDWPDAGGALAKLREEIDELAPLLDVGRADSPSSSAGDPSPEVVDEAGDLLFAAVNVCRLSGVHPSAALARATDKFSRRFRALADRARAGGIDLSSAGLASLDRIWDAVKAAEGDGEGAGRQS